MLGDAAGSYSPDADRLREARRFALRFAAFAALGLSAYCFPYTHGGAADAAFSAYLGFYAQVAGFLLAQIDPGVSVHGSTIAGRAALEIVKNCDAMEMILLFSAAVLASDAPWRQRSIALAGGLAVLCAVNLTRICSLYFAQIYAPDRFETIHLEIWPPVMVALATLQFLAFASWFTPRAPKVVDITRPRPW